MDKYRTWIVTWRAFDAITGGLVNHGREFRKATNGLMAIELVQQDTAIVHYYSAEQYKIDFQVAGGLGTLTLPEATRAIEACTPDDLDEFVSLIESVRRR